MLQPYYYQALEVNELYVQSARDIKCSTLAQLKPLAEKDSQTQWNTFLSRLFDATPTRIKKNIVSPFLSKEKVQSTKCELPSQVSLGEYDSRRCCCINAYHLCTTFLIDFDVSGAGRPEDLYKILNHCQYKHNSYAWHITRHVATPAC